MTWVAPDDGGRPDHLGTSCSRTWTGSVPTRSHTGLTSTITVTVDGDYRYRVRAINGVGDSVRSLFSATVTYAAPTGLAVTSVTVGTVGETTATITVNVAHADGSTVYARYSDDQTFPIGSTTNRAATISGG